MIAAVILLSIAAAVLLTAVILQRQEMESAAKQISELKEKDTNGVVHSVNGTAVRLIDEINGLLGYIRSDRIEYARKNHDLEKMMTNISHDLRTPLTSAVGYINILQNSDISEEEKARELKIIEDRLLILEELIDSFFEFSKTISSGKAPEMTELNLISLLEESIVHYYDDYSARGRQIMLSCGKSRLMINSNRNMLVRIFDNLISNSYKHGMGDLEVSVSENDGISVRFENGVVSEDIDIDHVFDEFYTKDISRTKGNTGLGLAIAKQFTEMLGGEISAELSGGRFAVTVMLKG
ncbi:MAG: HAMP domain-containing histidine kinase [Ruminococcus sp.]|nr:HAMP domain-containing histidine kinase [Ruminococcus sp.]